MKDALNFLTTELKTQHFLDEIKSIDEKRYNEFFEAIDQFFSFNFHKYITHNHLTEFDFSIFLTEDQPLVIKYIQSVTNDDTNTISCITSIFKRYYLYFYSRYERNSFAQYFYANNVIDALRLTKDFVSGLSNNNLMNEMIAFAEYYSSKVVQSIAFESQYRKQIPLEGFITSLTPDFKSLFVDPNFIPALIDYLYKNHYINSYGSWIIQPRRKTELLGLIHALGELEYIQKIDPFTKNVFCKTFRVQLGQRYVNSSDNTHVSRDAASHLKVALEHLYFDEVSSKRNYFSM